MKAGYSLYVVATVALTAALVACQPKSDNIAEKLKKQSEEIQRETDKQIEEGKRELEKMNAMLTAGGLPANVYLSKVLVKDSSNKEVKPVDQIKIRLSGGLNKSGKPRDINEKELIQVDDSKASAAAEPIPEKTYINFGCDNLSAADIGDLKKVKEKPYRDTLFVNAARVFVCGKQVSNYRLMQVTTNEFIFSDATIELMGNTLQMTIRAKTLILAGKSKITHKGRKSDKPMAQPQPTILIIADEKLHTQGSDAELEIVSEGSSYQAPDKPTDKAETPADPKKDNKPAETPKK